MAEWSFIVTQGDGGVSGVESREVSVDALVIKRFLFSLKYPINLSVFTGYIVNTVNKVAHAAYKRCVKNALNAGLPEPRETKTPGLVLVEFYGEAGLLEDLDLEHLLRQSMLRNRLLAQHVKKISQMKMLGIEYKFEELEEWKPEVVKE